jgi:hypothetical protein
VEGAIIDRTCVLFKHLSLYQLEENVEETITHIICHKPEIRIEVTREWLSKLHNTGHVESREKRELLLSAIKRWVYLSWTLQAETPKDIQQAYQRIGLWNEIEWIKNSVIPEIVSPHKIAYITPEFTLKTGRFVQFDRNKRLIELDFSNEQPPRPNSVSPR